MASAKTDLMEFKEAVKCMGPSELKDCLQKTLNFLIENRNEWCFPKISPHIEAFLVGLASDTRNLECKLFNAESQKLAKDIIEVLELNRDVFRWTYAYVDGTLNKNLLIYKKIISNKIKMKPAEAKKSVSLISQTLSHEDSTASFDIPTGCKIQLLNTTLRFLKTHGEGVLHYPDMPVTHAKYMCMLVNSPQNDLNVGFGFKSLYAPLFEAMNMCGLEYEFEISFTEKGDSASLKLEKKRSNKISVQKNVRQESCLDKNSTKENSFESCSKSKTTSETNSRGSNNLLNTSLNSSTSSKSSRKVRRRNRHKLLDGVSSSFVSATLQSLLEFTTDVSLASVRFEGLTDEEAAFVKGVKNMAGQMSKHPLQASLEASLRASLQQLNSNIAKVLETCKFKVEEGHTQSKARFITLKKVPREDAPKKIQSGIKLPTKSRAFPTDGPKDPSKENLIQFKSAGKLNPTTGEIELTTDEPDNATDNATGARTKDNLDRRQTKLLKAMSMPVESDKGKRMMELMGWAGGALGARGGGILEPILPAIELPAGAGLGHVPPPKPETRSPTDFRLSLLHNVHDLILHSATSKLIEYKLPLSKKERNFVSGALANLNKRRSLSLGVKAEQELSIVLLRDMALLEKDVELRADVSSDLRKINLIKFKDTKKYPMKLQLSKLKDTDHATMTVLNNRECEVIDDDAIKQVMETMTQTNCKTPMAIRGRAMRLLFLRKFLDLVQGSKTEREFRCVGAMPKKMIAFLENVVTSVNHRVRCSHVADEEMYLYDDLMRAVQRDCFLDIVVDSPTKFVLRKVPCSRPHLQDLADSGCPKPAQDNNNNNEQNKSAAINTIINQNEAKNINITIHNNTDDSGRDKVSNEPITKENQPLVAEVNNYETNEFQQNDGEKCIEHTNIETKCDNRVNRLVFNDSLEVKEAKMQTKCDMAPVNGHKVQEVAKLDECDTKVKDNVINSVTIDKDKKFKVNYRHIKPEIETDDETDSSWSTCSDHEIDLSEFDKEIEELDKTLCEVGLGFNVRDSDSSVSPMSDSPDYNKLKTKKTERKAKSKHNVVVVVPKNPDAEMHTEIFKTLQNAIWNQIDAEDNAIPLLKCHGIQNGGLIYSCRDAKDVVWLKKAIKTAKLDLRIKVFAEDFIEERKSRKMAVKINSFMPLDAEKLLSKIELYNDIDTQLWKVLSYESFSSYVIFIVDIDETSFEYISEKNFSLYMGIDKAQFSIIF